MKKARGYKALKHELMHLRICSIVDKKAADSARISIFLDGSVGGVIRVNPNPVFEYKGHYFSPNILVILGGLYADDLYKGDCWRDWFVNGRDDAYSFANEMFVYLRDFVEDDPKEEFYKNSDEYRIKCHFGCIKGVSCENEVVNRLMLYMLCVCELANAPFVFDKEIITWVEGKAVVES